MSSVAKESRSPFLALLMPAAALLLGATLQMSGAGLKSFPPLDVGLDLLAVGLLVGAVIASAHHAENVAVAIGGPLGTLVLTLSVTSIEVVIITSMMLHDANNPTLARDSVYSVVMIVLTGLVGLCLLVGSLRFSHMEFQVRATSAFLSVLTALVTVIFVLPEYTFSAAPGYFSTGQLIFVSIASALLYFAFLFIQTVLQREDFESKSHEESPSHVARDKRRTMMSVLFLLGGLIAVSLLAEHVAASVEDALKYSSLPQPDAIVGALIASLILMPEGLAAVRAAAANDLQKALNIALGSTLATIGLTIPAVAAVSIYTGKSLQFGLEHQETSLMVLAIVLSIISFGNGRTNLLTGLVHLVTFAIFVLLLFLP